MSTGPHSALALRQRAQAQALRLCPSGLAPDFLAEAIWHRSLLGSAPSDAEVRGYLDRCAEARLPVSGRPEHEPAIHPAETYRAPGIIVLVQRQSRGRYTATVRVGEHVAGRPYAFSARTRTAIHRLVTERWPGGQWSVALSSRDAETIRRRWGVSG